MVRENTPEQVSIGATERSFAILEQLSEDDGAGISELAETLGLSKSTVYNHLQTLTQLGYVIQDEEEYRIGLQFLSFGDQARQRHKLYHVAKPETDSLVEEVGERAQVMVEEHGKGVYIYQTLADQGVKTDSHIGTVVNLHATAVGKSYLAHLPDDQREAVLDQIRLQQLTPQTVDDMDRLRQELADVAEQGYALNDEERTVGMRAVGAPVISDDGELLGSISVSGPKTRMNDTWFREDVPEIVRQSARIIGIKATYPHPR